MSDIFREVEEDVRRDRLEKFWKANGGYIVALIGAALLAVAGYQLWQRYEAGQREKDFAAFTAAQRVTDPKTAAKAFADLAKSAGGGYAALAKMAEANSLLQTGQRAQAVAIYKDIADSETGPIGMVARLRAGWAQADTASRAELQTLLQQLLDPGSAWKQMGQEILAYSDYRSGKLLVASGEFNKLAADTTASEVLRNRARAFATYIANGGAANVGTMPPPAPAPLPDVPAGAAPP